MKNTWYNSVMKILTKILILLFFFAVNCASAEPFRVLVIPTEIFSVCNNYYCFPEVSEIFAEDVIKNFNESSLITSPDLYTVRKKLSQNQPIKNSLNTALERYKKNGMVDFKALDDVSKIFNAKSVLIISSNIISNSTGRNVWEVMEVMSAFEAASKFTLTTTALLTDNVNDIIMWNGKYKRELGDNQEHFWAANTAQAFSQLEKIRFYSKDILAKNISQNVILRFYPKVTKPIIETKQTPASSFVTNPLENNANKQKSAEDYGEIQSDTIYNF